MRTNILLNDELVAEGFKLTHAKTKKELVNLALKELVERKKHKLILELEGKVSWEGNLEEMRSSRFDNG